MKQAIGKDQVAEKLDAVKRSPILMIDDIGADAMSSWIRDEVFGVILQIGCRNSYQPSSHRILQWMNWNSICPSLNVEMKSR